MAKNKGLKWIVGLSSVAVFTGFVGLSQKYDQTSAATTNASQDNDNGGSYFNDESHSWKDSGDSSQSWSDSGNGSQFGGSSDDGGFGNGFSGQDGFNNGGNENSDSNQIRGHAS